MAERKTNPSPKQVAVAIRGFIGKHKELVDSQQFQDSTAFAESEYIHQLCHRAPSDIGSSTSEQAAAACFQRILGVHEFLRVLRTLADSPVTRNTPEPTNLDHTK
jgi:hypothetical protein